MTLKFKLIMISLVGFALILTVSLTGTFLYYNKIKKHRIQKTAASARQHLDVAMAAKKKVWQTNALQVATSTEVKKALLNRDRATANRVLKELGVAFKENTGFKNVQIHLIDRDIRSFYKSWDPDNYGEPLGHSRGYVQVKQTGKSYTAMEVSSKGLRLKGLFPVFNDGTFVGIANFEGGLNSVKRTLKPYDIDFLYFMDEAGLSIAKGMAKKPRLGSYILNQKDVDKQFFDYARQSDILSKLSSVPYHMDGQYLTTKGQFRAFDNTRTGLYLLGIQSDIVTADIAPLKKLVLTIFSFLSIVFFLLILGIIFFVTRSVVRPITQVARNMEEIATGEGDLTQRIVINTQDEIGTMVHWFNAFIQHLNDIILDIGANTETVTAASGELVTGTGLMSKETQGLSEKAKTVAMASEGVSGNMGSVAATSEQASGNVKMVSDATSQMQSTLAKVSRSCDNARTISDNATAQVGKASRRVESLGTAAREITKVTEVITEIAEQINLLALNATIEAARAGEAGRGFNVVASEIKNLASQTAQATEDIKEKILGIQDSTSNTVKDVSGISGVISEVNEIVSSIAAAVEEQSTSAAEVARNLEQASNGMGEMNENVHQASQGSSQISREIANVSSVSQEMSARSLRLNHSAEDLRERAALLRKSISVFKVSPRQGQDNKAQVFSDTTVPDLISWGPGIMIGLDEIDAQHKELVALFNRLHRAMKLKQGSETAGQVLDRLAEYTIYHFKVEEDLFNQYGYPETLAHTQIHEKLKQKVVDFKAEYDAGKLTLTMELMDMLTDWLKTHIMETDQKYVPFLKDAMAPKG